MTVQITIQPDEDGTFIAECPAIPGCISQGATADEAAHNIREAIRECLAVRAAQHLPATLEVREITVSQ